MITSMIYMNSIGEQKLIHRIQKDVAAFETEEYWEYHLLDILKDVRDATGSGKLIDFLCFDLEGGSIDEKIGLLEGIRKEYRDLQILLIAHTGISPLEYVRPGISAQALLIKPFDKKMAGDTFRNLVNHYITLKEDSKSAGNTSFMVDTREGRTAVPFNKILFFEARDKKVVVCYEGGEISFYNTIDNLMDVLPDIFIRSHRSFIVNRKKISEVHLSENLLILADGVDVPLSRSYKPAFKGMKL